MAESSYGTILPDQKLQTSLFTMTEPSSASPSFPQIPASFFSAGERPGFFSGVRSTVPGPMPQIVS
jgi:hypothetical protein